MAISNQVSEAIVIQTCAKIASELVASVKPQNMEEALIDYQEAFERVLELVDNKINRPQRGEPWPITSVPSRDEMLMRMEQAKQVPAKDFEVTIRGEQNGPIPAWLHRAARKAGISEVWDNRKALAENPKRPHFIGTDDNATPFWAPKGDQLTSGDIKFGM